MSSSSSFSRLCCMVFVAVVVVASLCVATASAKKDSGCEALPTTQLDVNLFNFDCSDSNLTWALFPDHVMWSVHYSTDLNLASNAFDPERHTIYDRSFYIFEKLVGVLNLSSNQFEHVQEHAFFYEANNAISPLKVVSLDLSNNNFKAVPWNALKYLTNLRRLSFKSNPIRQLTVGEFVTTISPKYRPRPESLEPGASFFFSNLQELDLSECHIEYVEPRMVDHLKRLQVLDLSGNRLRTLSYQVALALLQTLSSPAPAPAPQKGAKKSFTYLNVRNNPLECDCNLLWLKNFLINHQHDSEATCLMNATVAMAISSTTTEIFERMAVVHVNDTPSGAIQLASQQQDPSIGIFKMKTPILSIEDEQFVCELDLRNTLGTQNHSRPDSDKLTLRCHVLTYPKANIWWTYGNNRVLSKTTFSDPLKQVVDMSDKYAIYDEIREANLSSPKFGAGVYVQDMYRIESTLVLKDLRPFESDQFSCHVSHEFAGFKARKFFQDGQEIRSLLIMDPIDSQSKPTAIVRSLVPQKSIRFLVSSSTFTWGPFFNERIVATDGVGGYRRQTPLIYWIILGLCILFSIIVVVFVLVCIVRHRRKLKKEEPLYMSSSTGGYSTNYSSYDWKSSKSMSKQRSPHTLSSFNDLEATMPLKPDVIRRHADYSPVYSDVHSPPSPSAPLYKTPFKTTTTSPLYASPFQTPMYQNLILSSGSPRTNDQSFDNDPVDSSIMYENDPNTISLSSKSFDENIEEYQDPKMGIDLRKPVPTFHPIR